MAHTCERAGLRSAYLEGIIRASSFFFLPLLTRVRGRGLLGSSLPASNAQAKLITQKIVHLGDAARTYARYIAPLSV